MSQYGDLGDTRGPSNYLQLVAKSASMQGFTMMDYMGRIPAAVDDLSAWVSDGSLRHRQHVLDGLDQFPEAFRMLFRGDNIGKLLLRVHGDAFDA